MRSTLSTLLLLLFSTPLLSAQTLADPVRLNLDEGSAEQVGPLMTVAPDGTLYVAWVDLSVNPQGDIVLRRSDDGGVSFSEEYAVYRDGRVPAGRGRSGDMVVDRDGVLHVTWVENIAGGTTDIRYARSADRGESFSEALSVVGTEVPAIEDFPSIAVDSSGILHIAWIDGRELKEGSSDYDQIWTVRSLDAGLTFEAPQRASFIADGGGGSCECCNTAMEVTPEGDVLIAFRSNINNVRDVWIARSPDRGETYEKGIRIASEPWNIFACPVAGPDLAIDRFGTAHVMWKDNRESGGGEQYLYRTLLPNGATEGVPDVPLTTNATRTNYPSIALSKDGVLAVTFDSYLSRHYNGWYFVSGDGGVEFTDQGGIVPEANESNQQTPAIAFGGDGARYLLWQDDRDGNSDIYFAIDGRVVEPIVPGGVTLFRPDENETVSRADRLIWSAPENFLNAGRILYLLEITNSATDEKRVHRVFHTTGHPLEDLPDGTYTWSVRAYSATGMADPGETRTFTISGSSSVEEESRARALELDLVRR